MNKLIKYTVIIVLLIILIYYFLQYYQTKKQLNNEVSIAEHISKTPEVTIKEKTNQTPKKSAIDSDSTITIKEPKIDASDKKVSYLTAYRELKLHNKCFNIFYDRKKGKDLISAYISEYTSYSFNSMKPSEVQIQYYQIHIDACYSLLLNDKEDLRKSSDRIYKRFDDTTPETPEEIALSQALEIEARLAKIISEIRDEKSGDNQLSGAQKKANFKRGMALNKEIMAIYDRSPDGVSDEDLILMKKLSEENKKLRVLKNHVADSEKIEYLEEEVASITFELEKIFRDNKTPDIFLIYSDYLLNELMGRFYFTDDLNNKLGIYDTSYITLLNKVIVPFIACSMDYPCGPESYLSIEHCTDPLGFGSIACGKNIEDFYLEDLISPNQIIDFNNYLNYILDNHAQI
jgi:hypothetical protein